MKRKDTFKDLLISAQTNCVLKIKLKNASNPIITAVDAVSKDKVVLKPTCLYGYRLRRRNISLLEIESVQRYKTHFDHPLFQKIRFIRQNIGDLRKNFEGFSREPSLS